MTMKQDQNGQVWMAPIDWQPFQTPAGNILDRLRAIHGDEAYENAEAEAWFLPEQFAPETFESYVLPVRAGLPIYLDGQFITAKQVAYLTMAVALEHHVRSLGQLGDLYANERTRDFDWQRLLVSELSGKLRKGAASKVPVDALRELFEYNPATGEITSDDEDKAWWAIVGGYWHIEFDHDGESVRAPAAHIAVALQTGQWPLRVRYEHGADDLRWSALSYDLGHDRSNFQWASGVSFNKRDRLWRVHVPACAYTGRAGHQVSFKSEPAARAFRSLVERAVLLCEPMPQRPN